MSNKKVATVAGNSDPNPPANASPGERVLFRIQTLKGLGRRSLVQMRLIGIDLQKVRKANKRTFPQWLQDNEISDRSVRRYISLTALSEAQIERCHSVQEAEEAIRQLNPVDPTEIVRRKKQRQKRLKAKQAEVDHARMAETILEEENAELQAALLDDAEDDDAQAEAENQRNKALASKDKRLEVQTKVIERLEEENMAQKAELRGFAHIADLEEADTGRLVEQWENHKNEAKYQRERADNLEAENIQLKARIAELELEIESFQAMGE